MTRIDLGLAVNDGMFLVVGYALLYALGLARLKRGDVRLLGLAYLLGWAGLGVVLSIALMLGIGLELPTVLLVAVALVVACAVAGRRNPALAPPEVRRERKPLAVVAALIGAAILVIELVAAVFTAVKSNWSPDLDVVTAWLPRAETIFYSHHLSPTIWNSFLAPWYPPLVPAMYAESFAFMGGFHPSALPLQQVLLGIAFVLAVLGLLDRFAPRWVTLPSLALLLTTPWFWWRLHSLLPDQTLAYLLATAALVCVLWLYERRGGWLGIAAILLMAAGLTKLEGALFGFLLAAVVIGAGFALYRSGALPACVLLMGPAMFVPWHFWLADNQVRSSTPDYNAGNILSPSFLAHRVSRFTEAIHFMVRGPFALQRLTAVVVCISIAVVLAVWRRLPVISVAVAAWLTLSFLGLAGIYWTGRIEIHWYLSTSASRVGTTIIVAAGTLTPLLLGLALRQRESEAGTDEEDAPAG